MNAQSPAKILVVDDKQMMRDSVAATLQRAGFVVVVADGGAAALPLIARHQPAAVVTDLKMPGMDGLALLTHLADADPDLPVVSDDRVREHQRCGERDEGGRLRLRTEALSRATSW